ncbi:hypothetical protein [Seleniivibrio woodruffii]|uniref:hypothetical protein n=1 Tax=Seleniivibrio woodruffii TaxID=1078050 RepID=UPI0026F30676|nr:hypothetical protein [Seleniivibrio woodruffii]
MRKIVWLLLIASLTVVLSGCWDGDSSSDSEDSSDKVSEVLSSDEKTLFTEEELAVIDSMSDEEIVVAANAELDTANSDGSISSDELAKVNAFYKMAAEKSDEGKVLYAVSSVATATDLVASITTRDADGKDRMPIVSNATNYIKGSLVDSYYSSVSASIDSSLALLDNIDSSFAVNMTFGGTAYDVDYGDVLTLKAALEAAKMNIAYAYAYNIKSETNYLYLYDFTAENEDFLTPSAEAEAVLSAQKAVALAMLENLKAANDYISAETDSQSDDLVLIDGKYAEDVDSYYNQIVDSMNGTADFVYANMSADLSKLFTVLALRGYVTSTDDDTLGGLFGGDTTNLQNLHINILEAAGMAG